MVYGYYPRTLKKCRRHEAVCPECGARGQIDLEAICRVHHYLYIPFWSTRKGIWQHCKVCDRLFPPAPEQMEMARNLYAGARRRWYHFLGPIFIALLVGAFTVSDVLSDREEQQRIREKVTALQEGYIIYYRLPQGGWTSMFVDEIRGDSVVVRENRLSVDKQNDVRRIDDQENYSHKQTLYPRSDLVRLADEKRIGKIYRNYTYEMEYLRSLENK